MRLRGGGQRRHAVTSGRGRAAFALARASVQHFGMGTACAPTPVRRTHRCADSSRGRRWPHATQLPRQAAHEAKRVHHARGTTAARILSLRCSSSHAALSAGESDQVQLLDLPAPWRTLGVLRIRNRSDRRTPGEYGRVHMGRQDAAQCAMQDVRMCHPLGATRPRGRRQAWCQSQQL
jgi:hypothetical protein